MKNLFDAALEKIGEICIENAKADFNATRREHKLNEIEMAKATEKNNSQKPSSFYRHLN